MADIVGVSNIQGYLEKYVSLLKNDVYCEIEAKYRSYDYGTGELLHHVTWEQYNRIKLFCDEKFGNPVSQQSKDITNKAHIRQTIIYSGITNPNLKFGTVETSIYTKKEKIRISNNTLYNNLAAYNIFVSFSTETNLKESDVDVKSFNDPSLLTRIKNRVSYVIDDVTRIDLTMVNGTEEGKVFSSMYEVELEFIPGKGVSLNTSTLAKFFSNVLYLRPLLDDSNLLISNDDRRDLITSLSRVFPRERNEKELKGEFPLKQIFGFRLAQSRELSFDDMVYGGLVGNQRITDSGDSKEASTKNLISKKITIGTRYTVTWKVDGVRKLLYIDDRRIWLLSPGGEVNLVIRLGNKVNVAGTILEGELVPFESRRTLPSNGVVVGSSHIAKYWFIPYDTIAKNYLLDIQAETHFRRLNAGRDVVNALSGVLALNNNSAVLELSFKSFIELKNVDDFYYQIRAMYSTKDNLPYLDDGLIFTPEDVGYIPSKTNINTWKYEFKDHWKTFGYKENGIKRILPLNPDIVKWKPEITIDFLLVGDQLKMKNKDGNLVVFKGDLYHPFDGSIVPDKIIEGINTETVVEFKWVDPAKYDNIINTDERDKYSKYPNGAFVPLRLRPDKKEPNLEKTVMGNWRAIHDEITTDTMLGRTFNLMYKYYNRIKSDLLVDAAKDIGGTATAASDGPTLLDIGSGIGGDVSKWSKAGFKKIVAVEPDIAKLPELKRRIELFNMSNNVEIVNTGGGDEKTITAMVQKFIGRKVDVVSLMLSMSFFWNSKEHLQQLINTIKSNLNPGGTIIFLTIDGESVKATYEWLKGQGISVQPTLVIPPATLSLDEKEGKLLIDIKGTIVNQQTEYLVILRDFYSNLNVIDQLNNVKPATGEKFLSPNEKIFTRMYSYGRITLRGSGGSTNIVEAKTIGTPLGNLNIVPGFNTLVTIDGPLGLLETVLMSTSEKYRTGTLLYRENTVSFFREVLSETLKKRLGRNPEINYWEASGYFLDKYAVLLEGGNTNEANKYSVLKLSEYLMSNLSLNIDFIPYILFVIKVNMILIKRQSISKYQVPGVTRWIIILTNKDEKWWIPVGVMEKVGALEATKLLFEEKDLPLEISKVKDDGKGYTTPNDNYDIRFSRVVSEATGQRGRLSNNGTDDYYNNRVKKLRDKIFTEPSFIKQIPAPKTI
ncbi:MAG: mRNA-capping enzyme [Solumvirus sp.]|uniref:mRNA-capping enzyme n=1 Tax=Solumvirus sp. TaxID=2487773 RepID=A0A3G5AGG5_9VIRU|nr:MAG: mRNA-capping enzyme [Solumvirus sp.]